jgi:hypothetical protein
MTANKAIQAHLAKIAAALLVKHLGLAIAAAEWCLRIGERGGTVNAAMVGRLKDIERDLAPKPPVPVSPPVVYFEEYDHVYDKNRSIDDLVAGAPPLVEAQLRDILEGTD